MRKERKLFQIKMRLTLYNERTFLQMLKDQLKAPEKQKKEEKNVQQISYVLQCRELGRKRVLETGSSSTDISSLNVRETGSSSQLSE